MKKRIFILLSVFIIAILAFCGCQESLSQNTKLSELRTDIFMGENADYSVVAVTGVREEPFNIDGVSQTEKVYFTVITVTPVTANLLAEYNFSVTIGGQATSGKLSRHPFNETYSAEIGKLCEESQLTFTVTKGERNSEIVLSSVKTENFIDHEKAFAIAEKKLSAKLSEKTCDYEIFVRLIENPISGGGGYYWYVAYIFEDDTTCAVLIEPVTMEIAAVRD